MRIKIAVFRRKKRNTLFPAARFADKHSAKANRAAGGRDAAHLPKRCYGHLQPLQPAFVPVAVITSIRYYHVVKKPDIHYSSRFQQGMCQAVVVLTWLEIT